MRVTRTGSSWSVTWPKALKLGPYTAKATQTDDAGHTALTPSRTFIIVRGPTAIGNTVTLSRSGHATASVPITCLAPSAQTCTGNVLILTSGRYRPVRSGPSGQLRVIFASVSIPGGTMAVITRAVTGDVAQLLRPFGPNGGDRHGISEHRRRIDGEVLGRPNAAPRLIIAE